MGVAAALGLFRTGSGSLSTISTHRDPQICTLLLTHHTQSASNSWLQKVSKETKKTLLVINKPEIFACLDSLSSFLSLSFSLRENIHICEKRPVGESNDLSRELYWNHFLIFSTVAGSLERLCSHWHFSLGLWIMLSKGVSNWVCYLDTHKYAWSVCINLKNLPCP